jgi:hypothetical protein
MRGLRHPGADGDRRHLLRQGLSGLSAEFLAALGFWAGIPWALKMPLGHLVDLIWRYKAVLVYIGAAMLAASLLIMLGLLARPEAAWRR